MKQYKLLAVTLLAASISGCDNSPQETNSSAVTGSAQPITIDDTSHVSTSTSAQANRTVAIPGSVNLGSMPKHVPAPASKRNIAFKPHKRQDTPIGDEAADKLREEAKSLPPSLNLRSIQPFQITQNTPVVANSFESLKYDDAPGSVPPDPELAVGPNHIIAVANSMIEVYDKSGTTLAGPITSDSLFTSITGCSDTFDPNVLYDEKEDRFFIGIDSSGGLNYCIAVSQTANAAGNYWIYALPTGDANNFFDYPHAGIGEDAIYFGSNNFGSNGTPFTAPVYAIDKHAAYAGDSISLPIPIQFTGGSTPQPSNLHGYNQGTWPAADQPHYILFDTNFDGSVMSIASWSDPFDTNVFTIVGTVNLNTASGVTGGYPIDAPQSGGSNLQANDWRPQDAEYRDGFIWMTHTISCNPGSGTVNCLRWAKIDPTGPTVVQSGVVSSDGDHRTFPDLAVNHCNDVTLGYSKTGSSQFPSVNYTGRLGTDTAGTMDTEATLKAGEGAYTAFDGAPHRWGDYSGATSDPDGLRTWYLGEYSETGNADGGADWGTWIGEFTHNSITELELETVSNTQVKNGCRFEAGNDYIVDATGDVTLNSKYQAIMYPGFSVETGGTFVVNADPFLDLTPALP